MLKKILLSLAIALTLATSFNQVSFCMQVENMQIDKAQTKKVILKERTNTIIYMPNKKALKALFSNHDLRFFAKATGIIEYLFPEEEMDSLALEFVEETTLMDFESRIIKLKKFSERAICQTKINLKNVLSELVKINTKEKSQAISLKPVEKNKKEHKRSNSN